MPRTLYLIVYNSPLFPAHWTMYIPSDTEEGLGTGIHATGDAADGFEVQFERRYNYGQTRRTHQQFTLGHIGDEHVEGGVAATRSTDKTPRDALEQVASTIPAPGPSLISASSSQVTSIPPSQVPKVN
jgi:hypothetical protein